MSGINVPSRWRHARWSVLALALSLMAGAFLWTTRVRPRSQPNILLVVVDSLRVDRVGATGSKQRLTPFLDRLAAQSLVYTRAYAPSSWTAPVVASLFTGQYPSEHGVMDFFVSLRGGTTLAEALAAHGYATSGVTANAVIQGIFGFGRGFERYQLVGNPTIEQPKSDGPLVNDLALRWIDEVGPTRPHFLYLHYMDVHSPYRPHDGLTPPRPSTLTNSDGELTTSLMWNRSNFTPDELWRIEDLYDGEVQYVDGVLRELFDGLERRGFLNDALVIVTADHGEQFGRHGVFGHGAALNETVIHVPLLVRRPDGAVGQISHPVELGGLPAFILAAASAPRPASMHIAALPGPGDGRLAGAAEPVHSELLRSGRQSVWKHKEALVLGTRKLVLTADDREIMYDLERDPFERRPLPDIDATLQRALEVQRAALKRRADADGDRTQVTPDAATLERLRAAGYLQNH